MDKAQGPRRHLECPTIFGNWSKSNCSENLERGAFTFHGNRWVYISRACIAWWGWDRLLQRISPSVLYCVVGLVVGCSKEYQVDLNANDQSFLLSYVQSIVCFSLLIMIFLIMILCSWPKLWPFTFWGHVLSHLGLDGLFTFYFLCHTVLLLDFLLLWYSENFFFIF